MNAEAAVARRLSGRSGVKGDGPYIYLDFTVQNGLILDVDFEANGCPPAQLAGCGIATYIKGRKVENVLSLDANDLSLLVGGFSEGKGFYAQMAIDALRQSLSEVEG